MAAYIRARVPVIYVVTWEEEQLIRAIKSMIGSAQYIKDNRKMMIWSITKALYNETSVVDKSIDDTGKILNYIEKYEGDAIFILKDIYADLQRSLGRNASNQFFYPKNKRYCLQS